MSFSPGALADDTSLVGQVVSLSGTAYAERPGTQRRALGCGDPIHAYDRVLVSSEGRLGVLSEAVYTQIEEETELRFGASEESAPQLELVEGRVRVVDTRLGTTAPRMSLATPQAQARGLGTDSEAYILAEKSGRYSLVCEWGKPLAVARRAGGESLITEPGECAVAKEREALYKESAHAERIPLAGGDACGPGAIVGPVAQRFATTDVAAPPLSSGLFAPAPPAFDRQPCDTVGCLGVTLGVVESPPTPGGVGVGSLPE
jgi:hypothetical protein